MKIDLLILKSKFIVRIRKSHIETKIKIIIILLNFNSNYNYKLSSKLS